MEHIRILISYVIYTVVSFTILIIRISNFIKEQEPDKFVLAFDYFIITAILLAITIRKYNTFSDKKD